jgi:hypothetical protein
MEPIFKVGDEVRFRMPKHIPTNESGEWIPGIRQGNITSIEIIASSNQIKGEVAGVEPDAYNPKLFPSADSLDGAKYHIKIKSNHPAGLDLFFTLPNCCLERVTNGSTLSLKESQRICEAITPKTAHLEEVLNCPCVTAPDPDKPYKFNFKN